MRNFFRFIGEFCKLFWVTRGVLTGLLITIFIGGWILSIEDVFSFWEGVYLGFITAFTIGYGDVVPTTVYGRVTAVLIGYLGLVYMGLTVAIATLALKRTMSAIEK